MALISCPECNSRVSDRATSCPKCGYPLGQEKSFADLLANGRWVARSSAMAAESLEATFASDGSVEGILSNPPDDLIIRPQRVRGRWHVASPLLLLSYSYVTVDAGPGEAEFAIEITEISDHRLSGVDKGLRLWEFERLS
jgi:zinc-ribbon domain